MTRLLAIADLRIREGLAARLAWLVPVAFAIGVATALWAEGADAAARSAIADRVALTAVWGIAFVVAAIVPALGLPADIRTGSAQTLLSAPVSRFEVVLGGTLGYGTLASLLLAAMAAAATLGMQAAGVGAGEREPLRPMLAAALGGGADREVVAKETPAASFRFRVPDGLAPGEPLRVRFAPQAEIETNVARRAGAAIVSVHAPGGDESNGVRVAYKAGPVFVAHVPVAGLRSGDEAELTFRRVEGTWRLVFPPGSVEIGGARRLYTAGLLIAALAAAPFLFLLAAIGSLGAARFGAPTAVAFAAFLFLLFIGRNLIVDAAQYMVRAAADPTIGADVEDHEGHHHLPPAAITPARLALAKGALAVFSVLPRYDTFDRTDALVERRAPDLTDVGRAAGEGLPAVLLLTAAGWLVFRRRELQPG